MPDSINDLGRDLAREEAPEGLREARVVRVEASGMVWVTVDRQSGTTPRGPCPYAYGAAQGPQVGDRAWVQAADSGRLVVLAWWP